MELTDEQKQRILEEERQRLAEEQYRVQVRRELENQNTVVVPVSTTVPNKPNNTRRVAIMVGAVLLLTIAAIIGLSQLKRETRSPTVRPDATKSIAPADRPSPLSPPPPQELTTALIAERATPSVVVVESFNEDGEKAGQGSGYIFSGDGVIITNYHVIRGAKSLNVRVPGQEPFRIDSVLGYEIDHDVAALQVSGDSLPALTTETVEEPKVGDRVVAIGAPLGLESTVSEGIVSAIRNAGTMHIIQTTASISSGSSGGPLLNAYGKVVGLTTATMVNGQSLNFVVAARHISELLSHKESLSLEAMLEQTKVSDPVASSTIMVPARNAVQLTFMVNSQQGATLEGTYAITGGHGADVGVALTGQTGVIVNSGRVAEYGQFKQRLPRGKYAIVFDNRFSTFSAKSISPDLKLTYYR